MGAIHWLGYFNFPAPAARDGELGYDQLHHFIESGVWDAAPLEKALLAEADRMVGGADAWLIVDDTALRKRASIRSASRRSMPRRSERPPTVSRWSH
jgi:hypothetical protein